MGPRRITPLVTLAGGLMLMQFTAGCAGTSGQADLTASGPVPVAAPASELIGQYDPSLTGQGNNSGQGDNAGGQSGTTAQSNTIAQAGATGQPDNSGQGGGTNAQTDPSAKADPSAQAGAAGQGGDDGQGVTQTPFGPLTPADRDLIVKVRLAGLWEIPTGRQAAQRASRAITRKNLGEISRQHTILDAETRQVATKLRVPIPDEPNSDQQGWMAEISSKTGLDYDKTAVMYLRLAHGKVFPAIAQVRATTRNTVVRKFAEDCNKFVNTHMGLLEGTGLAGPLALPPAPTVTGAPDPVPSDQPAPSAPPATLLLDQKSTQPTQ